MTLTNPVSDDELKAHYCLESVDKIPGDPETSAFKRRARLQQALWRESKELEIGTQPINPRPGQCARLIGSRISLKAAQAAHSNFLNEKIHESVFYRIQHPEQYQMLNKGRLYCDLLSSMPMCFNLFGSLFGDLEASDRAIHQWWPDVPGRVSTVRFEWSPGRRLHGQYLENQSAFDVAFELKLPDESKGVVGIETKYHEDAKPEKAPEGERLRIYEQVAIKSGIFKPEAYRNILGTDLQQIWLDHLLALSMLQNSHQTWSWAKFILVYPACNVSYARAADKYVKLLNDLSTFEISTIESLLDANALPVSTAEVDFKGGLLAY